MIWHVLDVNSIWIKEFTSALSKIAPAIGWVADFTWFGFVPSKATDAQIKDPPLRARHFPLQRGYSEPPVSWFNSLGSQVPRMKAFPEAERSPLICTTPYYAPVAEKWPGPVVYYLTDLTKGYAGANAKLVTKLDRRMCSVATLVCPNSQRIADYLQEEAHCPDSKIVIIPNATRAANLAHALPQGPGPLPPDIAHLPRPIVGVAGNLAENQDWLLIREVIDRNPAYSWVLVGGTDMPISNSRQREARKELMERGGSVGFAGFKPYGQLQSYVRSFDVALLPYQPRNEPTYSGSSTRFYEHLAACRPMLATRGFEELLRKEPLLKLVDNAEDITAALSELCRKGFRDGREQERWEASKLGTWENRACTLKAALESRLT